MQRRGRFGGPLQRRNGRLRDGPEPRNEFSTIFLIVAEAPAVVRGAGGDPEAPTPPLLCPQRACAPTVDRSEGRHVIKEKINPQTRKAVGENQRRERQVSWVGSGCDTRKAQRNNTSPRARGGESYSSLWLGFRGHAGSADQPFGGDALWDAMALRLSLQVWRGGGTWLVRVQYWRYAVLQAYACSA